MKVKLFVPLLYRLNLLLCVGALPGKAIPKMTHTVLGEMLNPTHSLNHNVVC